MTCQTKALEVQYVGEFPSPIAQLDNWQFSPPTARLATDDDALSTLWAVLPEIGRVPLSTLGILLGPGGWRRQFGRLGSLQAFIESHSEYFDIVTSADTFLVGRADVSTIGISCRSDAPPASKEELLQTIRELIPPTGIKVTQLGSHLGNWSRKYAHLAEKLQQFLEQNTESFFLDKSIKPAMVFIACGSTATPAGSSVATLEEALHAILGAIPPGVWVPLPQLGSALGTGGWKAQFGHLGPLRKFLEMFPDIFMLEFTCKPPVVCRFDNSPPLSAPSSQPSYPSDSIIDSYPTAEMARDALLSILPSGIWVPLPQLGTALGFGGWKRRFGHLGALLPFLEANPIFFTVDYSQGETPVVRKGPDLDVLTTVFPVNLPEVPLVPQQAAFTPLPGAHWPHKAKLSSRTQPKAPPHLHVPPPRPTPGYFYSAETFVPAF